MIHLGGWPQTPWDYWRLYVHHFKSVRMFQLIFEIFDLQGDGFAIFVMHLFHHAIRFQVPFPGNKIAARFRWSFSPMKRDNNG
jgi:hypothetical protein